MILLIILINYKYKICVVKAQITLRMTFEWITKNISVFTYLLIFKFMVVNCFITVSILKKNKSSILIQGKQLPFLIFHNML